MAKQDAKYRFVMGLGPAFPLCLIATLAATGLAVLAEGDTANDQSAENIPQYDAEGNLRIPTGFHTWVFVGSNLGMGYRGDLPAMTATEAKRVEKGEFHNIYINPEAYAHFTKSGTFPDPTILVMEHYLAADKEPKGIVDKGVFNGKRSGLEVAVKNSNRPDSSKTPWAYYNFWDNSKPSKVKPIAEAFPDRSCFQCHLEHASTDNVWVQFYPVLRRHQTDND